MRMIIAVAMCLAAMPAYAGSESNSVANSGSASLAAVNITNNGASKVKTTGSALAPGLIASGLSCSGSASIGGGWMGGAISLGITTKDKECDARENSKIIGLMGDVPAAKEVMCNIKEVREAFAKVGRPCIADRGRRATVAYVKPSQRQR